MASAFGFRYLEVYKTNEDIENFMADMLDCATMHNGFNNPYNGNYMFSQVVQEKMAEYKLDGKISGSVQYNPAPGIDALNRNEEVYIVVTPIYMVLSPWSNATRVGKAKDSRSLTHGYVKVTGKNKSDRIDAPVVNVT